MATSLLTSPIVDDTTRREFIALLGAAGLLSACGSGEDDLDGGATRSVQHALGVSDVPVRPSRVVAADAEAVDYLLALGLTPVGWVGDLAPAVVPRMAQSTYLGGYGQLDLEILATLDPDLIVGADYAVADTLGALQRLAPVVAWAYPEATRTDPQDIEPAMRDIARLTGREPELEPALTALRGSVDAVRRDLTGIQGATVTFARLDPDQVRIYFDPSFTGDALSLAGFTRPPGEVRDGFAEFVSFEQLDRLRGEYLVVGIGTSGDADLDAQRSRLLGDPLWSTVPAVAAGKPVRGGRRGLDQSRTDIAAGDLRRPHRLLRQPLTDDPKETDDDPDPAHPTRHRGRDPPRVHRPARRRRPAHRLRGRRR